VARSPSPIQWKEALCKIGLYMQRVWGFVFDGMGARRKGSPREFRKAELGVSGLSSQPPPHTSRSRSTETPSESCDKSWEKCAEVLFVEVRAPRRLRRRAGCGAAGLCAPRRPASACTPRACPPPPPPRPLPRARMRQPLGLARSMRRGARRGLVLDVGEGVSHAVPVYEGAPRPAPAAADGGRGRAGARPAPPPRPHCRLPPSPPPSRAWTMAAGTRRGTSAACCGAPARRPSPRPRSWGSSQRDLKEGACYVRTSNPLAEEAALRRGDLHWHAGARVRSPRVVRTRAACSAHTHTRAPAGVWAPRQGSA